MNIDTMIYKSSFQDTLNKILDPDKGLVKRVSICNTTYYVASDIIALLGISNITRTNKNINKNTGVKRVISSISKFKAIHLVTIEGVLQIILNGNSGICYKLKEDLALKSLANTIYKLA